MSYNRTVTEFSSVRKLRSNYGGDNNKLSVAPLSSRLASTSLSSDAAVSPHKAFFGRDEHGREAYYIQFNIGDFNFNDITIQTDGQRLQVKGKSQLGQDTDNLSRQFNREFRLPDDVEASSIKAQLDERSRVLTLIGQIIPNFHDRQPKSVTSSYSYESAAALSQGSSAKVGTVRENRSPSALEYEVYLGNQLGDGQISLEVPSYNTLLVRVNKSEYDPNGDTQLEIKRQLKLPSGINPHNIEHRLNHVTGTLVVKVPLR